MARRKRLSVAVKRKLYLIAGIFFFCLGILGLFLPILQGVLFLFVSLVLLSRSSSRMRLMKRKFIHRYPQWGAKLQAAEKWTNRLPGRIKRKILGRT